MTASDPAAWHEELKLHDADYDKLAQRLPKELLATRAAIEARLQA